MIDLEVCTAFEDKGVTRCLFGRNNIVVTALNIFTSVAAVQS